MSTKSSSKPTIVLVPGAWCPSSIYEPLTSRLKAADYKVQALDLPSNGDPPSLSPDWQPDVRLISSTIQTYADQGDDVIIVAHSAGGQSSSQASEGLSKHDREAEGKRGGIVRIVYLAALVPNTGAARMTREQVLEIFHWVRGEDEVDYPDPELTADILFGDLDSEAASTYASYIQKSAWRARCSPETIVTYAGWKHIPCSYLLCENDKAIAPEMQEMMIAQGGGKFDDVVRLKADHSAFVSQPDFVEKFVRRAAGETGLTLGEP